MSVFAAAALGLGLGMKHAIEADHLAAVSTLVARGGSVGRAARSGALWGAGHAAVVAVAGSALVLTGAVVPRPIAITLDVAVAAMLVGLGVAGLVRRRDHHEHAHASRRPLAIGILHGASGTAALTLLVATTIPIRNDALAFVALFALASVAGMTLAAALVAVPLRTFSRRIPAFGDVARGLAGAASIIAGVVVAWATIAGSKAG